MHQICSLTDLAVLAVHGKDAGKFLQGQSTCDLLALPEGSSTLGAFCNPKGRVIALFRAFHHASVYYLLVPRSLAESVAKRLRMYALRADVQIEWNPTLWHCFGLLGTDQPDFRALGDIAPPDAIGGVVTTVHHGFLIRLPAEPSSRFLLLASAESADPLVGNLLLRSGYEAITLNDWRMADIRCGIPLVVSATTEEFVPQMLNLDRLGGISFNKGCYTGQEIVARTHYLGTLKRAMFRLSCTQDTSPEPGQPIYLQGQAEQPIGQVLIAARHDREVELLAVLNTVQAQAGTLHVGSSDGPLLRLEGLPYP